MLLGLISATEGTSTVLGQPMPPRGSEPRCRRSAPWWKAEPGHLHLSGQANLLRIDSADRHADPRTARTRVGAALERVGLVGCRAQDLPRLLDGHEATTGDRRLLAATT